jgi:hypothetical protein
MPTRPPCARPVAKLIASALLAGTLISAFVCAPALAQDEPAPAADPLSGPALAPREVKPSLVVRDASGALVRPEGMSLAEAAFRKLKLDPKAQAAGENVLKDRARLLDDVVATNLIEIGQLANAFQSGNRAAAMEGLAKLWKDTEALRAKGQLNQQLAKALPKAQGDQLLGMVQEYMQAVFTEERQKAQTTGESFNMGKVIVAENLKGLGQEIKASYERVIGQSSRDFEQLIKDLDLTPEQEGKLRTMVQESLTKYGANAPAARNSAIFMEMYRTMTPQQRRRALELLAERRDEDATKPEKR